MADDQPPLARIDQNFDPFTHNALGRTLKLGVAQAFQGAKTVNNYVWLGCAIVAVVIGTSALARSDGSPGCR